MQLAVKYGATLFGGVHDLVMGHYDDGVTVRMEGHEGCILVPYTGALEDLQRLGPEPENPLLDSRFYLAPPVDLAAYLKAIRYAAEVGGVSVKVGSETAVVSTARGDDRTTLNGTYSAIRDGLRRDGATFNFQDGIPRSVSNADMKAACLYALAHIQATFDAEAAVKAKITAGEVKGIADVGAAFAAALAAALAPPAPAS